MRWWVWLLLLLNLGLFTYFNFDKIVPPHVAQTKEISPDKLKILSQQELEAMPKKEVLPKPEEVAAPASVQVTSCYRWGNFSTTNLPAAQVVLVRLGLQATVHLETIAQEDRRYWVYYPPLRSAELAKQKADEIRALGVEELFIVQDSQWRNAISFGLFAEEALASKLLTDLQAKGVKGATKALRNPGKGLSSLLIQGVAAENALELQKVKPEFVGSELVPAACQ
jgi:hypothetical protein